MYAFKSWLAKVTALHACFTAQYSIHTCSLSSGCTHVAWISCISRAALSEFLGSTSALRAA